MTVQNHEFGNFKIEHLFDSAQENS